MASWEQAADRAAADRDLIERVRDGAPQAFEALYDRYFSRVYGFLRGRTRDRTEVEDLVQETFLEVFRSVDGYAGRSDVDAWILGVARNVLRRHVRDRLRRESRDRGAEPDPRVEEVTPEDELRVNRVVETLLTELSEAEPWEARGFALRYVHGLPVREVARRAERSRHVVQVTLQRLRRRAFRRLG
jgi:RNA polymerase sigma-70 factor (ECF subfamily)